jgi:hypothetical protein
LVLLHCNEEAILAGLQAAPSHRKDFHGEPEKRPKIEIRPSLAGQAPDAMLTQRTRKEKS